MSPANLLQSIESALRQEVTQRKGTLEVCEDELSALLRLEEAPSSQWVCLLLMTQGVPPGGSLGGRHDLEVVTLIAYVSKPSGLPVNPAAGIYRDTAAGRPLLDRVHDARHLIQRMVFVEPFDANQTELLTSDQVDTRGCIFKGWRLLAPDEAPANSQAARLTFELTAAFDAPEGGRIPVPIATLQPGSSTPLS